MIISCFSCTREFEEHDYAYEEGSIEGIHCPVCVVGLLGDCIWKALEHLALGNTTEAEKILIGATTITPDHMDLIADFRRAGDPHWAFREEGLRRIKEIGVERAHVLDGIREDTKRGS